jgi:hypothetical protein
MPVRVTKNNLSQIAQALEKAAADTTMAAAFYTQGKARESMAGPKSGRLYKVSETGELHQASAPGEAPAIDTTNLSESVQAERVGNTDARTFVSAEYAAPLEFGTARMAPRPFLIPAAHKAIEFIQKWGSKQVKKALSRFK